MIKNGLIAEGLVKARIVSFTVEGFCTLCVLAKSANLSTTATNNKQTNKKMEIFKNKKKRSAFFIIQL